MTWPDGEPGVVVFPDGTRIRGRSRHSRIENAPEFGVYLLGREPEIEAWESRWIPWPDFGLPRSREHALLTLSDAIDRAARLRVEVACDGGTGRTGTALALAAVACGVPEGEAVAWVRAHYRPRAVETPFQRRFVRAAGRELRSLRE